MRVKKGPLAVAAAAVMAMVLAGCGGNSSDGASASGGKSGGDITVLLGTTPDSLDPAVGSNVQSSSVNWLTHLGLVSYKHEPGEAGFQVIPALAESMPKISSDGLTYDFTLRSGLKYSDGTEVKASDFKHTVERVFKLNWGGKGYLLAIKGAPEYSEGKADSITGITADDAKGTIKVSLTKPYGALTSILGLPAMGLVPSSAPMKADITVPGVGPYQLTDASEPNKSYAIEKVASFADQKIPDIPTGSLDKVTFKVVSNNQSAATSVLDNTADVFDAHDTVPPGLLPQIEAKAKNRFALRPSNAVFYFWMNTEVPPFDNIKVRQAVAMAISRPALAKLSSGQLTPECYFLPKNFPGHPTAPCPWETSDGEPKLDDAKALVQQSGTTGTHITVWGQQRSPRSEWVQYLASVLDSLGYKADVKTLADSVYYPTIGNEKTKAQIGTASFEAEFADPYSLYIALDPAFATPTNAYNLARAKDPKIGKELAKLAQEPISDPSTVDEWQSLDEYATEQAYHATFGVLSYPQFYSDRVVFSPDDFHANFANDWSLVKLK
jgi:peptide/nickel transport system substrate-binding protein